MKRNIYLMYAIALLQGMVFYAPIATLYRAAQGVTVFQITLIESISLGLSILLEIPWGFVADRIGYKKTFLFCCVLYFLSKVVFWQADGFGMFLLERVMLSFIIAGLSGVDTSILYLSCEAGESQKAFGIYSGLETVGMLAAALIYSRFIGEDFRLAGALTVVSYGIAVLAALGLKEVKHPGAEPFRVREAATLVRSSLKDRRLLLLLLAISLVEKTHHLVTVFFNQLQYERCGMSASAMGYAYIAVTLAGLSSVLSQRITKKLGFRRSSVLLSAAAMLACFLLAGTESGGFSVFGILAVRVAGYLFDPLQREMQNRQIRTENRATALSVNAMIIDGMSIGVSLAFGALAERDLPAAFLFGAVLCLAALLLLRYLLRSERRT